MQQLVSQPDVRLLPLDRPYAFAPPFEGVPFALMLVSCDPLVSDEQRNGMADKIVRSGCRYVCCAGYACEEWHDAIDMAFLATDPEFDPPDERHIMTTWHEKEALSEVAWFFVNCTSFDGFRPEFFLILLLGEDRQSEAEVVAAVRELYGSA